MNKDVNLDLGRADRTGLSEAVLAEPKSTSQLEAVIESAVDLAGSMLFTRFSTDQFESLRPELRALIDHDPVSCTGFLGEPSPTSGDPRIAVVCAGTSDRRVAAEVERTLEFAGVPYLSVSDVGVAGLWRLTERLDELGSMSVVVVLAGMEGALPAVVAGLVPSVVIAVPTSIGYGVAVGGRVALDSALSSCAPGVVVVNIDNGYGAACAALRVLAV